MLKSVSLESAEWLSYCDINPSCLREKRFIFRWVDMVSLKEASWQTD
ncbi:hypothetical protein FIU95_03740 [Microbulbifer sp. THAF38]|nr:hypothetical protein FIU95_03740 [Microbulbifer sp. THAF38]